MTLLTQLGSLRMTKRLFYSPNTEDVDWLRDDFTYQTQKP